MPPDPNGNGSDNPNGDDAPNYVTKEDLNQIVNAAITGHMKRAETRMASTIGEVIKAQLAGLIPKPDDDPGGDPPPGDGKTDPAMTALKRQMSTMANKLQKAEESRDREAAQRRADGLRTSVLRHLGEAGLNGQHLRGAQAVLYQDGRVHVGDDGANLYRDADGVDLPLAEGLKGWVASDDAKLFLPPKDVRGSGARAHGDGRLPKMKDDQTSQAYADALEGAARLRLNQ